MNQLMLTWTNSVLFIFGCCNVFCESRCSENPMHYFWNFLFPTKWSPWNVNFCPLKCSTRKIPGRVIVLFFVRSESSPTLKSLKYFWIVFVMFDSQITIIRSLIFDVIGHFRFPSKWTPYNILIVLDYAMMKICK